MDQELIRQKLNVYIQNNGVTAKWIAVHCNIPEYTLSRFRSNKIDLYEESLQALDNYLKQHTQHNA